MNYTIAEILHYAADEKLASKEEQCWSRGGTKEKFSCCAMYEAVVSLNRTFTVDEVDVIVNRIIEGLKAMGCPTDIVDAFDNDDAFNSENQQARYAWLKFAATIAEEQGV